MVSTIKCLNISENVGLIIYCIYRLHWNYLTSSSIRNVCRSTSRRVRKKDHGISAPFLPYHRNDCWMMVLVSPVSQTDAGAMIVSKRNRRAFELLRDLPRKEDINYKKWYHYSALYWGVSPWWANGQLQHFTCMMSVRCGACNGAAEREASASTAWNMCIRS